MEAEIRIDHKTILDLIEPGSRVLDLGCGRGDLLELLVREKNVRGQGIELDDEAICECVKRGLSVLHGDIEQGLVEFPDGSFDYVILNQSLQEVRKVDYVIGESLRVADKVIIGFPNFACLQSRCKLFFQGRAPVTPLLPYCWYDTPNVRFLSVRDFKDFAREKGYKITVARYLRTRGVIRLLPNLRAVSAIFVLTDNK